MEREQKSERNSVMLAFSTMRELLILCQKDRPKSLPESYVYDMWKLELQMKVRQLGPKKITQLLATKRQQLLEQGYPTMIMVPEAARSGQAVLVNASLIEEVVSPFEIIARANAFVDEVKRGCFVI